MTKRCALTGQRGVRGYTYAIRGIAKKKKGIGLKVTGKSRRTFEVNLVTKRIWVPEQKRFVKLRIAASSLRTMDKRGAMTMLKEAGVVR